MLDLSRRLLISSIISLSILTIGIFVYKTITKFSVFGNEKEIGESTIMKNKSSYSSVYKIEKIGDRRICFSTPRLKSEISLEEALRRRRSVREYESSPLTIEELSQLLWAAYGVTETTWSLKTTPSAGGTYPLDIYVVARPRGVSLSLSEFLAPGSYRYDYKTHCIELVKEGDLSSDLYQAALMQEWVRAAPVNIVLVGVFERTTRRYGDRGIRYVWMESGHASQNIYLQATALGLGTVAIGAFYDDKVREAIGVNKGEPLYIMPIGRAKMLHELKEENLREYYESNRT